MLKKYATEMLDVRSKACIVILWSPRWYSEPLNSRKSIAIATYLLAELAMHRSFEDADKRNSVTLSSLI